MKKYIMSDIFEIKEDNEYFEINNRNNKKEIKDINLKKAISKIHFLPRKEINRTQKKER